MNPPMEANDMRRRVFGIMEGVITAALMAIGALIFQLNNTVVQLQTTVSTLTQQLGDVQGIRGKLAEMEVRINRNSEDIKELRNVRELK